MKNPGNLIFYMVSEPDTNHLLGFSVSFDLVFLMSTNPISSSSLPVPVSCVFIYPTATNSPTISNSSLFNPISTSNGTQWPPQTQWPLIPNLASPASPTLPILPISSRAPNPMAYNTFSHLVFTVSNIKNFVSKTLNHHNFIVWRELMVPVLKSKAVYAHFDGTDPCPSSDSPNFETWMQIDYQILSWIQARISTEHVKGLVDKLHGVGHPKTDGDLVFQVLAGLDSEYRVAKRIIAQRNPFLRLLELHSLLLIEEATLLHEAANRDTQPMISPRGRWSSRRGGRRNVRGNRGRSYGGSCHFGFSITFGRGSEFSGGYFSSNHGVVSSRALPPLFPTLSTPVTCSFISCQWCQQPNLQACDCPLLPIQPMTASTSTHQSLVLLLLPLISIGILPQDIKTKNIL
ncbi:hypothetical protein SLEP1_g45582 [Rubroshorea leprosula]|uniref:Retrotransposon Copia-like N-terminal domain-containing protein n=1 Tax=Rubroshorea leprosula TaxID=152421 RepID=A0AAV5LL46_9ROSI|nr:hypothetical protein SLEP1_g45582 [Rubroshorea leprosula]